MIDVVDENYVLSKLFCKQYQILLTKRPTKQNKLGSMASNAYDKDNKDDGASEESDIDMDNDNLNEDLANNEDNDPTVQTDQKDTENENDNDDENGEENRPSKMKFDYRMQVSAKHATEKQKMEHLVFRAILSDAFEDFNGLIKSGDIDLKQMDSLRWTPLMTAVQKRRTKIVKILIDNDANIYKRDIVELHK